MKPLLIATNNPGKFKEISLILSGVPYHIYSLNDFYVGSKGTEDGQTYAENAYIKARHCAQQTKTMTLADDSGIIVEALQNELGVKTRRWGAGEKAPDLEWVNYFLRRMENETNRKATFVCCACLVDENGEKLYECSGETRGVITTELRAPIIPGLPLSSCFQPEGYHKVYALLGEEKSDVSHRGKAFVKMKEYLSKPF